IIALRFLGKLAVYDRCRRLKGSCPSKGGDCGIPSGGDETVGEKRGGTCLRKRHVQYLRWSARCLRKMRNVAAHLQRGSRGFVPVVAERQSPSPYALMVE